MPQDNFGRVIPSGFAKLPVAMQAECLALLAERAREAGMKRRLWLIEDRQRCYRNVAPYRLPDVGVAPPPDRMTRDTAWHMSPFTYAEVQRINRTAREVVARHWPHCDASKLRNKVVRLLAFIAETHADPARPVYAYDLASAFGIAEEVLTVPLREAAEAGFLIRNDEFSWFISPEPPSSRASRAAGPPAGPRKGSDGRSALRPAGGERR